MMSDLVMSDLMWQGITLAATALSLGLIAYLALTYRNPRPVSQVLTAAYLTAVPAVAAVYLWLIEASPDPLVLAAGVLLGAMLGWWQGGAARVYLYLGRPYSENAAWFLAAWGLAYCLTQITAIILNDHAPLSAAAAMLALTCAVVWFRTLRVFVRASGASTA